MSPAIIPPEMSKRMEMSAQTSSPIEPRETFITDSPAPRSFPSILPPDMWNWDCVPQFTLAKTVPPEMILNWRELETATDRNIDRSLATIYKKIYYFTQLLQYYVKEK